MHFITVVINPFGVLEARDQNEPSQDQFCDQDEGDDVGPGNVVALGFAFVVSAVPPDSSSLALKPGLHALHRRILHFILYLNTLVGGDGTLETV